MFLPEWSDVCGRCDSVRSHKIESAAAASQGLAMPHDEGPKADERSLGGDEGDGRSVSTLDIADVAASASASPDIAARGAASRPAGAGAHPRTSLPDAAAERRASSVTMQMEEAEQEPAAERWLGGVQCDMKVCTIAFVATAVVFVVVVVALGFALAEHNHLNVPLKGQLTTTRPPPSLPAMPSAPTAAPAPLRR